MLISLLSFALYNDATKVFRQYHPRPHFHFIGHVGSWQPTKWPQFGWVNDIRNHQQNPYITLHHWDADKDDRFRLLYKLIKKCSVLTIHQIHMERSWFFRRYVIHTWTSHATNNRKWRSGFSKIFEGPESFACPETFANGFEEWRHETGSRSPNDFNSLND